MNTIFHKNSMYRIFQKIWLSFLFIGVIYNSYILEAPNDSLTLMFTIVFCYYIIQKLMVLFMIEAYINGKI